jgi:hypothetical protein
MKQLGVMFQDMQETLGKALMPVLRAFMKILKPLMPIIEDLAEIITLVVDAVMPLITAIMDALMPAFKAIVKVLKPILASILPPLIKLLDKILVPVLMFLSDIIVNYLVPYFEKMGDVLGWLLDNVVNFLVAAFENMLKVLGPLWEFLKPVIDGIMAMFGMKVEPVIAPKLDDSAMSKLGDLTDTGLLPQVAGSSKGTSKPKASTGDSEQVKALKETQKQILDARKEYHKAVKDANDAYAAEIKNQINAFRDVFRQATQINLGDLFSAGNKTADALVESLKDKLAGITTFSQDIAEIAGAGFSSDFVKEVMGLGPVAGHELASAIMGATPEVRNQILELYNAAQDASRNGVNDVATTMTDMFAEATQNLTDALQVATETLNATLMTLKGKVTDTVVKANPKPTPTPTPNPNPNPNPAPTVVIQTLTEATPEQIASTVVNQVKFGLPYVTPSASTLKFQQFLPQPITIPASPTH